MMLGTRAVERRILERNEVRCAHCDQWVKFAARQNLSQVVANVYKKKKWDRVEHFHRDCYDEAGLPYGEIVDSNMPKRPVVTA